MKNLLNQYSYAIFLIILSCSLAFLLSLRGNAVEDNKYLSVTISEGDSLWKISSEYANQHSLSNKEFVSWVKKHNNIRDIILPGEVIIIPVNHEVLSSNEFASAAGE
ncbi:LysM peptidoglycan-binding domain-containing protein [Bacillus sp. MRMR6]|uniref:cell division suppressor protein YneA n=1 Tax=Bacillus sp. MRMR6 TaxID=1928617 RepID=UPI000951342D|nr:LysM peptidoglycan-binding domain-containing protein [Bacillus sp. MRMR6]OLS39162.1 cell division suppressor protein YneA [Bacillus sp. MRMR6]